MSILVGLSACAHHVTTMDAAERSPPKTPEQAATLARHQASFVHAAIWALVLTYDDDNDDPSLLTASLHQLQDDASLAAMRGQWQEILSLGLARSHELQRLAPQLRAMRRAFAHAFVDELTGSLSGVDAQACRAAMTAPSDGGVTEDGLVVTIEPLGPHRFSTLRRLCRTRGRPPAAEPAPSQTLSWPVSAQPSAADPHAVGHAP